MSKIKRKSNGIAICAILALFLLFASPKFAQAQVPVSLAPTVHIQFTDGTGKLLSGGFLYTYSAGTTTRLDSYTDSTGLIANAWPIPLDATGSPSNGSTQTGIWISSSAYKFCAYNSALVLMWCVDNVIGPPFLAGNNNWTGNQTFSGTSTFTGPVNLSDGGSLNGSWSGSPIFTGSVTFSGTSLFSGVATLNMPTINGGTGTFVGQLLAQYPNSGAGGTVAQSLAKLNGNTVTETAVTDTAGVVGICYQGCGTTGTALITTVGGAQCNFDGATTAGDYVIVSATTAGDCHDVSGSGYPSSGQVIGRVLATNGGAGVYNVSLFAEEQRAGAGSNAVFPNVVYNTPASPTTANISPVTMATVGSSDATYRFSYYSSITMIGASCTGNTTAQLGLTWQDPLAATALTDTAFPNAIAATTTTPNGALGPSASFLSAFTPPPGITFRAKAGTVIQYSTTYVIGSGCSPGPTYEVFPILEQLTVN